MTSNSTPTSTSHGIGLNAVVKATGGIPLNGRVQVQGSKNIALHLYAAALLADAPVVLAGAPDILDTDVCARILTATGTPARFWGGRLSITPASTLAPVIDPLLGGRVRTTAVLAAAVLARAGQVTFPTPGGDAFCQRRIDRHLAAMRAAGAEVTGDGHLIRAVCAHGGVRPFHVDVATPYGPSLGATVTAMLLAARAGGTSLITNPSIEPEVTETGRFLTQLGITVAFDDTGLHVVGSDRTGGGTFAVAADRIEAATLIMAAAATGGRVQLEGVTTSALPEGLRQTLGAAGVHLADEPSGLVASVPGELQAVRTATGPHPDLPTDAAPQLASLLTQARGTSAVDERVYPRRDTHAAGLRHLGADVHATGTTVHVRGPASLRAAHVEAGDIRAVTALLIAALAAHGASTIAGMYHLRRGYGNLPAKLAALGADITIDAEAA
ncbi:UDP-N-acetylglucosamine 1-carboxyvinyltransferase [Microtetraspora malaysiensis]|uniref:UDP-N-acetylglucosamine 1-carboxyvinyltransferase n=1 Tax=Microtetraspora malaysiensis TaxID=161358 RepID=UPI003D8FB28D